MKALHFGAGNIGRGFIGKLLYESGYTVIFADINSSIIDRLNQDHQYPVRVVGENIDRVEWVKNVSGIYSNQASQIQQAVQDCDLITTAVGATVLEIIAPSLANALIARYEQGGAAVNVIACENMVRGTSFLKNKVLAAAGDKAQLIEKNTGFVDSAVDRIVPPVQANADNPLAVTVEEFSEWIVDETQFIGKIPAITGMQKTNQLMAFVERKLFTLNTGHAVSAYLGKLAGKKTVKEAIDDGEIAAQVKAVMQESGAVLIQRYQFDPKAHAAYIEKILKRFANPYLHDDVDRVGRQPLRKLSAQDRLIKPLNGMLAYALPHQATVKAIAAALHYHNPDDPQAVELQNFVQANGVAATLKYYAELTQEAVVKAIEAAYQQLKA